MQIGLDLHYVMRVRDLFTITKSGLARVPHTFFNLSILTTPSWPETVSQGSYGKEEEEKPSITLAFRGARTATLPRNARGRGGSSQ